MQIVDESRIHAVVEALSDEYCRKILAATSRLGKTPEEIAVEQGIPISTCYRRVHDLLQQSIIRISRIELSNGRKLVYYKSTYKSLELKFDSSNLFIDAIFNVSTPEERLAGMVSDMRNQKSIVHDCDLCQARGIACKILQVGESRTQAFVCAKCQIKVEMGQVPAFPLRQTEVSC
jgi:predicted transcriptional regulator